MFLALRSALFLAANLFSFILFSMIASSSLVKGRNVGRLLSESFSAWVSDMLGGGPIDEPAEPSQRERPGNSVSGTDFQVQETAVKLPQLSLLQLLNTTQAASPLLASVLAAPPDKARVKMTDTT